MSVCSSSSHCKTALLFFATCLLHYYFTKKNHNFCQGSISQSIKFQESQKSLQKRISYLSQVTTRFQLSYHNHLTTRFAVAPRQLKNEQLLSPREAGEASRLWREDTTAVTRTHSSLIYLNDRVSQPPLQSTGESSQGVQGCQPEGLTLRLFGSGECEPPLEDRTRGRVRNLLVDLRDRCPRRNYVLRGKTKQASCVGGETRTRAGSGM
ncbi:hypothetical protein HETIRDRAFT_482547 [Heterobasidion irregulare TC 32-1]|uniref:Uncharacterized protein n=1 Tax=Heterobasidion irregulare (strain TC 32-1) TaxID=747525 RepID=W4JMI0_HETIT|nr:uncharacterized protein HETIRDRAFT_482547 [Heterobasidion irregulare TC 32-1]ETW74762.1 hypothetical protein HETIRDRAFT_482547 [Heterobasidion irregulare TC 32-1]